MMENNMSHIWLGHFALQQKLTEHCKSTIYIYILVPCLLRATPTAYGDSQARGIIGAVSASLCLNHSNAIFKPHLQPTPQLLAMPDP